MFAHCVEHYVAVATLRNIETGRLRTIEVLTLDCQGIRYKITTCIRSSVISALFSSCVNPRQGGTSLPQVNTLYVTHLFKNTPHTTD